MNIPIEKLPALVDPGSRNGLVLALAFEQMRNMDGDFLGLYSIFVTVGFSGSGGAGKTPSLTKTFAGSRRIP